LETWRFLPFKYDHPRENMAVDEALFRTLQRQSGAPVLRFYGWGRPALSLGYFQDAAREINLERCRALGMDVVRRPTGGKAVLHGMDLTYAVVSHEAPPLFSSDLIGNYRAICAVLTCGFAELGIKVCMSERYNNGADPDLASICFAYPAPFELLCRGRKICGSAQVRSRNCFLQHGSISLAFDPDQIDLFVTPVAGGDTAGRAYLRDNVTSVCEETGQRIAPERLSRIMQRAFETVWGIRFAESGLTPEEELLKNTLRKKKYDVTTWNLDGQSQDYSSPPEPVR